MFAEILYYARDKLQEVSSSDENPSVVFQAEGVALQEHGNWD